MLKVCCLSACLLLPFVAPLAADRDAPATYIYIAEWSLLKHQAEMGNPQAQLELGNIHYNPPEHSGIKQSYRKAFYWYLQAALRGHATAQHNVGVMYLNGDLSAPNDVEAVAWFMLAAQNGDAAGKRKLAEFEPGLSEAQKLETRKRMQALQHGVSAAQHSNDFSSERVGIDRQR